MPVISLEESPVVTIKRARRLYYMVWAGVIWSLIYTSLSLGIMHDLNKRLNDSCTSRLEARVAIRDAFAKDPDWSLVDQAELDIELPPRVHGC